MTNKHKNFHSPRVEYTVSPAFGNSLDRQPDKQEERLYPQIPLEAMPIARAVIEYGKRQTITSLQRGLSELKKTSSSLKQLLLRTKDEEDLNHERLQNVVVVFEQGVDDIIRLADASINSLQQSINSIQNSLPENITQ